MIYFLIPMYNEEGNLELLHKNLSSAVQDEDCFYVFVDDNSSDNSVKMVKELFASENLKVITKETNHGPGHSFNLGFDYILDQANSDDTVVTLEADNTSDLSILPVMLMNKKMGFSLVLASVYAQGGGFSKTSFFRVLLSFVANMFLRMMFDIKVLTLSSFYRVYSVEQLQKIKTQYGTIIKEAGFICMVEILIKAIKTEASVIEVPMKLRSDNRVGKSKMKIVKTIRAYIKFLLGTRL